MLNDAFVIDAVTHAYNVELTNFALPEAANAITQMVYGLTTTMKPEFVLPPDRWMADWDTEDVANMLFRESGTDFAIFHPTAIGAYVDGMTSVDKAAEVVRRWPTRFRSYAAVDPLKGAEALEEFDRQVEMYSPIGLKLYPSSWAEGAHRGWRMDDPEIAFPFFERARQHGLRTVAIHKAIPFGLVPMTPYKIDDIDIAASSFPDLNFELVHGGAAFVEETSWLVGRFPNVWINLEGLTAMLPSHPRAFASVLLGLCQLGGPAVLQRLVWGTGCMAAHPRPLLEAFAEFTYPEDLLAASGFITPLPQITEEDKRGILGLNYARMAGLDIAELQTGLAGDEFSDVTDPGGVQPFSTTSHGALAGAVTS
jgi:predicted TIM-barrel fold metal-dependent hydrolase